MIPSPWEWALLALAAFRVWRFLSQDEIIEPIQRRILERWPSEKFADFMDCPWCLGFWIALAWVAAFWIWPHGTVVAAVPFALSAAVGVFAAHLDP